MDRGRKATEQKPTPTSRPRPQDRGRNESSQDPTSELKPLATIEYAIKWQTMDQPTESSPEEQLEIEIEETKKPVATSVATRPTTSKTQANERIEHLSQVGECFRSLYTHDHLTDAIIHIDDHTFNSHKAVLITHSEYFKNVLINTDREVVAEIEITGIQAAPFRAILEYLYSSEIELTPETIGNIHTAASHLGIPCLLDRCEAKLQKYTPYDALTILNYCTNKDSVIFHRAFQLVATHFHEVIDSDSLSQLSMNTLQTLLISDDLVAKSELDIFRAAIAWIQYKKDQRAKSASRMLGTIRYHHMTPKELLICTELMKGLKTDIQPLMMEGMWHAVALSHRRECLMSMTVPPMRQYTGDTPISQ